MSMSEERASAQAYQNVVEMIDAFEESYPSHKPLQELRDWAREMVRLEERRAGTAETKLSHFTGATRLLSDVDFARELETLVAASEEVATAANMHDREEAEHRRDQALRILEGHNRTQTKTVRRIRQQWTGVVERLDQEREQTDRLRRDYARLQDELVETGDMLEALRKTHEIILRAFERSDLEWEARCEHLIVLLRNAKTLLTDEPGAKRLAPKIRSAIREWEEEYQDG